MYIYIYILNIVNLNNSNKKYFTKNYLYFINKLELHRKLYKTI